jgi:hypothetical protein
MTNRVGYPLEILEVAGSSPAYDDLEPQLTDLYISPPSLVEGWKAAMDCMNPDKLQAFLPQGPTDQWRKALVYIGLALRHPEQFGGEATAEAARLGLRAYGLH